MQSPEPVGVLLKSHCWEADADFFLYCTQDLVGKCSKTYLQHKFTLNLRDVNTLFKLDFLISVIFLLISEVWTLEGNRSNFKARNPCLIVSLLVIHTAQVCCCGRTFNINTFWINSKRRKWLCKLKLHSNFIPIMRSHGEADLDKITQCKTKKQQNVKWDLMSGEMCPSWVFYSSITTGG